MGLQKGREFDKGEMGVQVGMISKILSVAVVKSQTGCLLSRLGSVGEGCVGQAEARENGGEKGGVHGGLSLTGGGKRRLVRLQHRQEGQLVSPQEVEAWQLEDDFLLN